MRQSSIGEQSCDSWFSSFNHQIASFVSTDSSFSLRNDKEKQQTTHRIFIYSEERWTFYLSQTNKSASFHHDQLDLEDWPVWVYLRGSSVTCWWFDKLIYQWWTHWSITLFAAVNIYDFTDLRKSAEVRYEETLWAGLLTACRIYCIR